MGQPESVFMLSHSRNTDTEFGHEFGWTLREVLEKLPPLHDRVWMTIEELHPVKGHRTILEFDAEGIAPRHYAATLPRWRSNYTEAFVRSLLDQWPAPIADPWKDQRSR